METARDIEMKKLRKRNCWTVVKRADIPKGTRVMGGKWTFKYKRDETGALSKVSHRSRYVAKGFTQIKNVHYFESFAPVASFVTLRLVFALTALPNFHVNHYDLPSPQEPIRHDTETLSLVSTLVHNLHIIRPSETSQTGAYTSST
jgi:hypothetical protein